MKTIMKSGATIPYPLASRVNHQETSYVDVDGKIFGEGHLQVIAGPCAVEDEEQLITIAKGIKASGAGLLRGGAFKPRTSPYSFQGLEEEGIRLLLKAKRLTQLPIVTELTSIRFIDYFADVDLIQIGARNMQNFDLLKEVGRSDKPVLLKRGLSNTVEELLMSVEYIMAQGNHQVILCERGIRTFEKATRNTLDISAVPLLKSLTHLPVVVDPSHACGIRHLVQPLTQAAIAVGADGVMIETHHDPDHALSDGPQSLTLEGFDEVMADIARRAAFEGKRLGIA